MHCGGGIKIIGEWHKTPKILAVLGEPAHRRHRVIIVCG